MAYFIPHRFEDRDIFKDESNPARYLRVVVDPAGTPHTYYPIQINCSAEADYQKWGLRLKNRDELTVGYLANLDAVVQVSTDASRWYTIFTGYVSDSGFYRTRGYSTDDYVTLEIVDATQRKGTKRKLSPAVMAGYTISDPSNPEASLLHILSGEMGVTPEAFPIEYTKSVVSVGELTVWDELKKLQSTFGADMYFNHLGQLRFVSLFDSDLSLTIVNGSDEEEALTIIDDDGIAQTLTLPSQTQDPEWLFQGDPDEDCPDEGSLIKGKVDEVYLPVRCNRGKCEYIEHEALANRVIYKNTEGYDETTEEISIEIEAGAYWPGPAEGDVAELNYIDPDTGETYPYAIEVDTPTIGTSGDVDILYSGGTLEIVSFNGSTTATMQNPGSSEIILHNSGGSSCTLKRLRITGNPFRALSKEIAEYKDTAITDEVNYVDKSIDGKYAIDATQVYGTLYNLVENGKDRVRRFSFATAFLPWIQRGAIVQVQMPGESAVRCRVDSYTHENKGRTLLGMVTRIICTEKEMFTPTGYPSVTSIGQISPITSKLDGISPGASATYRLPSTTPPSNPRFGDFWYQTDTNLYFRYSGSDWEDMGAAPLTASSDPGVSFSNASGLAKILEDGSMTLTDLYAENATIYGRLFHEAIETQDAVSSGSEVTFATPTHWSGKDAYDALTGVTEGGGLLTAVGTLDAVAIAKLARLATAGYLELGSGSGSDNFTSLTLLATYTIPTYATSFYVSISVNDAQVSVTKNTTNANDYFLRKTGSSGSATTTISVVAGDVVRIYGVKFVSIIGSASWSFSARTATFSGKGFLVGMSDGTSSFFLYSSFYTNALNITSPNTFDSTANDNYSSAAAFIAGVTSEAIGVLRLVSQSSPASLITYGEYTNEPILGVMRIESGIRVFLGSTYIDFTNGGYYIASGSYEILSQTKGVLIDNIKPMESTSSMGESGNPFYAGYFDNLNLGDMPMYACRAWVNFDGTGTVAIRESENVSSVTDLGSGLYQINFVDAMPDVDYSVTSGAGYDSTRLVSVFYGSEPLTGSFRVMTYTRGSASAQDASYVLLQVFR